LPDEAESRPQGCVSRQMKRRRERGVLELTSKIVSGDRIES
jgi:hypothetical protein